MFLTLLLVTLALAALVSIIVTRVFDSSIRRILDRLVGDTLAPAWARYVRFAIIVVGVSGGVRVYELERYVLPREVVMAPVASDTSRVVREAVAPPALDANRWVLEVYRTLIGTLQSVAWVLLLFFLVALIAYVLVRGFERRDRKRDEQPSA